MTQKTKVTRSQLGTSVLQRRSSGVLLHPSSLPGPYGIGDIGPGACAFIDLLASSKQSLWQMLPLTPPDQHNSPYASISAMAADIGLLSPDLLRSEGLIGSAECADLIKLAKRSPMGEIRSAKEGLVKKAWGKVQGKSGLLKAFEEFAEREKDWLEDFALFVVLADFHDEEDWSKWPEDIRSRQASGLLTAARKFSAEINVIKFGQFLFDLQWKKLKAHATSRGVSLVGDIPIFVNHGSVDVWASQSDFLLGRDGRPTHVSGVPPDYFIKDGQLWGHALYDWEAMSRDGFNWWIQRFARAYDMFDVVRIDHFIGFHRFWKIPAKSKTARTGSWVTVPGEKLFATLMRSLGTAPIIAEDLGLVTPEVHALRRKFQFPGMRVLQFGMSGSDDASYHRIHAFDEESVVYPGTHDNDTVRGWLESTAKQAKRGDKAAQAAVQAIDSLVGEHSTRAFLRLAHNSKARTSIFQLQDVLGLDGKNRMNVPGKTSGNWTWRWTPASSDKQHFEFLRDLTALTERTSAK